MKTSKSKTSPVKEAKTTISRTEVVDLKSMTSDELFLHILKQMGKPSLVRDMVKTIKDQKMLSIAKRKLLAKFYASASHLNRDGVVKRKAVTKSMYMYSLPKWKLAA
jgi:hypothetical protein